MSTGPDDRGLLARKAPAPAEVQQPEETIAGGAHEPLTGPARILIISQIKTERDRLRARLSGLSDRITLADGSAAGLEAIREGEFDLALVRADLSDGTGADWAATAVSERPGLAAIILDDDPSLDSAVEAMRAGAIDLIDAKAPAHELIARVRAALRRARAAQARERRVERLKRTCRQLNTARQEVTRQVGSLCNDLVSAYQELSDQMSQVSIASEFAGLIRPELDVEGLLRAALEYVLTRTGPTNAAVFLPSSSRDYSLGAYVNYSCPKDSADILLDTLANTVAPKLEEHEGILGLAGPEELAAFVGQDADWMGDSCAAAFACRHDDECLAVVILFRDRQSPFEDSLPAVLKTIADLFARQLARVIHIHHRHLPKDQWGSFDQLEGGDDDLDLAA